MDVVGLLTKEVGVGFGGGLETQSPVELHGRCARGGRDVQLGGTVSSRKANYLLGEARTYALAPVTPAHVKHCEVRHPWRKFRLKDREPYESFVVERTEGNAATIDDGLPVIDLAADAMRVVVRGRPSGNLNIDVA